MSVVAKNVLCLTLSALLVSLCILAAEAQQPKKSPRVGYLSAIDKNGEARRIDSIRQALREIGYIEGQNILTEYKYADGNLDRVPRLAEELVRLQVDVIVTTGGDPVIRAAKNATRVIPIVMVGGGSEPVAAGFVESLARPGGNITGLTNLSTELAAKRLETLKEAAPKIFRVAVLYERSIVGNIVQVKEVQDAAPPLGMTVQAVELRDGEFHKTVTMLSKQLPDGLYVPGGPVMNTHGKRIAGLRSNIACRPFTVEGNLSMLAVSCPTARTWRTATGASLITSIEF